MSESVKPNKQDSPEQEAYFRRLVETAPGAIVIIDDRGQIMLANARLEALFGYSQEELIGKSIEALLPLRFRESHQQYRDKYMHDPEVRPMGIGRDLAGRHKDGHEFPVEIGLSFVETDNGVLAFAFITDITERKRAEQALRESEERFRRLVETAPGAIVVVDGNGDIVLVNAQLESLFGYSRHELLGQSIEMLLPEKVRQIHGHFRTAYFRQPSVRPMGIGRDLAGRHKDGHEFPIEIGLSYTDTEQGTLVFAFITDISERKRAEEERQQLLLREQQAREKAEQAVRVRDEFLSVAAHELKTPITSMRGFAQVLLRRLQKGGKIDADQLQSSLEQINQQSIKLTRLLGHLLDISRIEAGRLTLENERFDIARLARTTAEAIQQTTTTHVISVDAPPQLHITGDVLRLEQVLVNLLDNAVKFTPDGGKIRVAVTRSNTPDVSISVTDEGIGIPLERRQNLFNRFYQAHAEGYKGGMGIGLYVSNQIVALHGGTIEAEFPSGGGSRFVITLPVDGK